METEDIEQLLENAKFRHLSEATLVSYRDSQLDKTAEALADAHLRLCVVCDRRLTFLREEAEALEDHVITKKDRALVKEIIQHQKQRLAAYIQDLRVAWVMLFRKEAARGSRDGDEVWRYESEDGLLTAWAILESDASLTVHFSSSELAWEGARIRFRLGPFSKEVTLQREEDSRVAARIVIPRRERARKMDDISIEVV